MEKIKYKRIVLKLSGEALAGDVGFGINEDIIRNIAERIKMLKELGVQISIVVGGGNFWRGKSSKVIDRTTADYIGMLATVMNSLAVQDILEEVGIKTIVQTSIEIGQMAELYNKRKAVEYLEKGRLVIFACGTGNPFFSTDTTAALRAAEINADVVLLAKKVDGVYNSDPAINSNAKKYDNLSYKDIINKNLGVMDSTAAILCRDNKIPIMVFALKEPDNIIKVIKGYNIGTIIRED